MSTKSALRAAALAFFVDIIFIFIDINLHNVYIRFAHIHIMKIMVTDIHDIFPHNGRCQPK